MNREAFEAWQKSRSIEPQLTDYEIFNAGFNAAFASQAQQPCDMNEMCLDCQPRGKNGECPDQQTPISQAQQSAEKCVQCGVNVDNGHCLGDVLNCSAMQLQAQQESKQESVFELLQQSKDTFERNFGGNSFADWIYSDLQELFSAYIPPAPEGEPK